MIEIRVRVAGIDAGEVTVSQPGWSRRFPYGVSAADLAGLLRTLGHEVRLGETRDTKPEVADG